MSESEQTPPKETPQELIPPDDQELKDLLKDLANEPPAKVEAVPIPDPKQLEPVIHDLPMQSPAEAQQVSEYAKKFSDVANEILGNFKADRDQINDTIEYLENLVFNGTGQRVHTEMLVAALRTKAETNGSAVKLLDSLAKFLAATKGTNIFVQNNHTSVQEDLAKILAKEPYLDETKNAKNK